MNFTLAVPSHLGRYTGAWYRLFFWVLARLGRTPKSWSCCPPWVHSASPSRNISQALLNLASESMQDFFPKRSHLALTRLCCKVLPPIRSSKGVHLKLNWSFTVMLIVLQVNKKTSSNSHTTINTRWFPFLATEGFCVTYWFLCFISSQNSPSLPVLLAVMSLHIRGYKCNFKCRRRMTGPLRIWCLMDQRSVTMCIMCSTK